ncbi:ABC transporter permease [Clostridium luticellarii]|jgi:oligopeptide transport system permease protein|uniref:Oligopeptide transport system permease protein OppC n=1 Tax=Clostridium luticellarii TaxID=1691940 RepID=A0A2T0BS16_9CLOT|nr:ABC transporter permease [Clostridium luticellarii]MCI1943647.1 ABC transporter permease [Clostridium luticellarii]MCI1969614.1 ABC transporter permease [Clostridium luticellarii]MCI1996590.1 ABC transporter permease [Clostridium luticellarii]MCI2038772.1 ABC transporter permease [Clostridium luticellarii]PRR86649.1 Oligopeptide transport system permease protein OppC [Clostridium luticellarii]
MELPKDAFEKVFKKEKQSEELVRPTISYWQDVWRRLKLNKLAVAGLFFVIFITLLAIIGPIFSKYNYYSQNLNMANLPPSVGHWFGTDKFGRDIFIRILYGARISLTVGYVASLLDILIGIVYGGIAGYFGGMVDNIMMRIVDILYSIPMTIYVILFMVVFGAGLKSIIIALAVAFWLTMARIVRGEIMSLKQQEFVLAAKTLGASSVRIILKHLIPNCLGPIIVTLTLSIPDAIFTESFLSFIGLGVSAPMASWGTLASDALDSFQLYPLQLFFPSIAICLTMLAFNLLGDGLRDSLDPKMKK